MVKKAKRYIFLRDVAFLSLTAFGGPQAHMTLYLDLLVSRRAYLTESELLELNALCQLLPGPTSTQTITAIGCKRGGVPLAFLTLLVWATPAVLAMTVLAFGIDYFNTADGQVDYTRFIRPMSVGFVAFAALKLGKKVIITKTAWLIFTLAALTAYAVRSPYVLPLVVVAGGVISSLKFGKHEKREKERLDVKWRHLLLFFGIFALAAGVGGITNWLPVRLFENFYRNGALIFGGGQVLVPALFNEFVKFKGYLTSEEFQAGYALVQAVPGPVFSFSAFVGALSMRDEEDGAIWAPMLGATVSAVAVFLPGTLLIFFVIRFWEQLKKSRAVRASVEGINAAAGGLVAAAILLLAEPLPADAINYGLIVLTFCLLQFTKLPAPFIILGGLVAGILF